MSIFNALLRELEDARKAKDILVSDEARNTGAFVFNKMLRFDKELDIIYQEDNPEQIEFLELLANFGVLNATGLLGDQSRHYRFTIPLLNQVFAGYYLSLVSPPELKNLLYNIYYNKRFKLVIAFAAIFRARRGEEVSTFIDGEKYTRKQNQYPNGFELLFTFYILQYLPRYSFRVQSKNSRGFFDKLKLKAGFDTQPLTPHEYLEGYFEMVMIAIKKDLEDENALEKIRTSVEKLLKYQYDKEYFIKVMDLLPGLIEKDEQLAEKFWAFCENKPLEDLYPTYKSKIEEAQPSIVRTKAFKTRFFQLEKKQSPLYDFYLETLIFSPYQISEVYDYLWSKVQPKVDEHFYAIRIDKTPYEHHLEGTERWGDQWRLFKICLLLLLRANLSEFNLVKLFYFLGGKHLDDEDVSHAEYVIGTFKSIRLTQKLGELLLSEFQQGAHFYNMNSIYKMLEGHLLHHPGDIVSQGYIKDVIDVFLKKVDQIEFEIKDGKDVLDDHGVTKKSSALWEDIQGFFLYYLDLSKISGIEVKVEQLFKRLLKLSEKGVELSRERFTIIPVYLIYLESEELLKAFETNEFCQTYLILYMDYQLKERDYFHHIFPGETYLQKLNTVFNKIIEKNEDYKSKEYKQIILEFSRRANQYKKIEPSEYEKCINSFLETGDTYELYKACKFEEFEEFLKNHPEARFMKYAIFHSIHYIKPFFIDKDEESGKVYYSFSI